MHSELKIEFLYWAECISHGDARQLLEEVVSEMDIEVQIEEMEVVTEEDAEQLAFPGSPTFRVNGADIDPAGAAQMGIALTCRVYVLEDGRFSPIPSKQMLRQALA